ncbi:MAG: hypothetical protein M5R41_01990 [Bacteroidia bacterium]|nr:hypothetical protein [Bacteroidia bacterium]
MMRQHSIVLTVVSLLFIACGNKEKPVPHPSAMQPMNLPPQTEQHYAADVDVSGLDSIPGFSKLPEVEREIFSRTVQLQVKHYENLERWADEANTAKTGRDASVSMRLYIAYLEDFEQKMKALDQEFSGKLSPKYAESKNFNSVVDAYMENPDLQRRVEYIMNSFVSLMQRFQDDPACRDVFAELQRMVGQAQ